ncbi:MAG: hypothetical protein M1818_005041 [Claussenomyces sp. TS43310]|nr:MAG: hypothetical protein M1818_005041 [Claussenomyces sp. TS43310]
MATHSQTLALVASPPVGNRPQWKLETVDLPELRANELLVEIVAAGAGYVRRIGAKVKSARPDDPVVLSFASCSACTLCTSGHPAYCDSFVAINFIGAAATFRSSTGGDVAGRFFGQSSFSKLAVVVETSVVNVSGKIDNPEELRLFAPLGCGLQTGAASVLNRAKATALDTVAVVGLGAVGMAAIMAAKITGCSTIIGIDIIPDRLQLAKEFGATAVIDSSSPEMDFTAEVKKVTNGNGPSVTIDATGIKSITEKALQFTATLGTLVIVGVPSQTAELSLNLAQLMASGKVVMSSVEGDASSSEFVPKMIQWYRQGKFPIDKLVKFYEVSDFESALTEMKDGTTIKPVLTW